MENGARARRELERAVVVDCRACRTLCEETLSRLLDGGGVARDDEVVRALMSAAAIAETAAAWLDDERRIAAGLLEFCVDACEEAAAALAQIGPDGLADECADTCRACADSIRALLWVAFEQDDES